MTFAHPILAGAAIAVMAGIPTLQSLRSGRVVLRGPGPPIYRRRRPGAYWSSIIGGACFAVLGAALMVWGLLQ
ncbi:MAG TPA: hypothetical protein VFA50_20880 [Stellaceae bacterium]|nr:hypothetical protein [Stellaceae bacterium]